MLFRLTFLLTGFFVAAGAKAQEIYTCALDWMGTLL